MVVTLKKIVLPGVWIFEQIFCAVMCPWWRWGYKLCQDKDIHSPNLPHSNIGKVLNITQDLKNWAEIKNRKLNYRPNSDLTDQSDSNRIRYLDNVKYMYCKIWPYCFNWQKWQIPIEPCHGLIIWWRYWYEHKYIQHLSCVFEVMLKMDHNPDIQVMGWNQKISCQNASDEHSSVYNCKTVVGPSLFSNGIISLQIFRYIKYFL